jgi:hypothetical protein
MLVDELTVTIVSSAVLGDSVCADRTRATTMSTNPSPAVPEASSRVPGACMVTRCGECRFARGIISFHHCRHAETASDSGAHNEATPHSEPGGGWMRVYVCVRVCMG